MQGKYEPLVIDVRQSRYGYWVVTISVAPGLRLSVMICRLGVTPEQAGADGLQALLGMTGKVPQR